jgi:hypothetical protein
LLSKSGRNYKFISEEALEVFLCLHLETLLNLVPFKRQLTVNGEISDIFALSQFKQLAILEIKNDEDRYIVQQLTRYYDNLISQKPFASEIDYDLPIRLIAIAPNFHRHNYVDKKYSCLEIEFWRFELIDRNKQQYIQLCNLDSESKSMLIEITSSSSPEENKERSRQEKVDETLKHYVYIRCGYKLGLNALNPEEIEKIKYRSKSQGSKTFKLVIDELTEKGNYKRVSVKVPSNITIQEFYFWIRKNVPKARAVITPSGRVMKWRSIRTDLPD